MIKRNHVWILKIFRAIKKLGYIMLNMIVASVLGLLAILSIFKWTDNPFQLHFLAIGLFSVLIIVDRIVIISCDGNK